MKLDYSNDVLKLTIDDKYITLSLKDEEFEVKISKENVKKIIKQILDSVEKTKKIDSKN